MRIKIYVITMQKFLLHANSFLPPWTLIPNRESVSQYFNEKVKAHEN